MTNEELLEQIERVVEAKLEAEREHTRKLVHEEVAAAEKRLTQKIAASQEDTIHVLSEVLHTGYNMHEERIRAIEEQLDMPHKN